MSPSHAMFLDGILVPAQLLANGSTIVREQDCARVDYVHVELAEHDVILAEGAPSETFVDADSRGCFQNAAEWQAQHPDRGCNDVIYCAPRVEDGFELEAIRNRLAALAGQSFRAA